MPKDEESSKSAVMVGVAVAVAGGLSPAVHCAVGPTRPTRRDTITQRLVAWHHSSPSLFISIFSMEEFVAELHWSAP